MNSQKKYLENQLPQRSSETEIASPFLEEVFASAQLQALEKMNTPSEMFLQESPFLDVIEKIKSGLDDTDTGVFNGYLQGFYDESVDEEIVGDEEFLEQYELEDLDEEEYERVLGEIDEDYKDDEQDGIEKEAFVLEKNHAEIESTQNIANALLNRNWVLALKLAIVDKGWRDENKLTNLIFFARHSELKRTGLNRKHPNFKKLSREWIRIRKREVWQAILKFSVNHSLAVSGKNVTAFQQQFRGQRGKKFKRLIEQAAKHVGLNPGLLAATLLAETGTRSDYLKANKVSSYRIGVDDFYDRQHAIAKRIPAFARVGWNRKQIPIEHRNDRKVRIVNGRLVKGRLVKTIKFDTGPDSLLASAVYLKFGEMRLRENAKELGGNFENLQLETRWMLIRMAFNAGVGGASKRLKRALKGEDILVRINLPRKIYQTDRNSTIHTAAALHLSDWVFGISIKARSNSKESDSETETEEFEDFLLDVDEELDQEELFYGEESYLSMLNNEIDIPIEQAEYYEDDDEDKLSNLEYSQQEIYDQNEAPDMEEQVKVKNTLLPRMKFEFQTFNRIWRNDGRTPPSLLPRKYGPKDLLVDMKGVRLESETEGVLEFETEWIRKWSALEKAINRAVKMTDDMNDSAPSKFDKTRKAFPFNIAHLRTGSKNEIKRGFWYRKKGKEGKEEKILGVEEELEVELIDQDINGHSIWDTDIQSSECFLLHQYESYLKQHHEPIPADIVIQTAKDILDAVRPSGTSATQLVNLESFLQIIVYYITQGQLINVKGHPSKFAFGLMSRTNFSSIYRRLLRRDERNLFYKIVRHNEILKKMGLNRQSPFFIEGYGSKSHQAGPTVYNWIVGVYRGKDLLSVRSGKGLSASMGRYNVENRKGKKDRWLLKFETRGTIMGREAAARDWVNYAHRLYIEASKRRRRPVSWILLPLGNKADRFLDRIAAGDVRSAISLAHQQGIMHEDKLTNLVLHSYYPELVGRRIRKKERALARKWLRIRNDLVRPFLQSAGSHYTMEFVSEALPEEAELTKRFFDDSEREDYDDFFPEALDEFTGEVQSHEALGENVAEDFEEVEDEFVEFEEDIDGYLDLDTGQEPRGRGPDQGK